MLAADETHAYFTIETRTRPPELYRVPLTGGAAVSLGLLPAESNNQILARVGGDLLIEQVR